MVGVSCDKREYIIYPIFSRERLIEIFGTRIEHFYGILDMIGVSLNNYFKQNDYDCMMIGEDLPKIFTGMYISDTHVTYGNNLGDIIIQGIDNSSIFGIPDYVDLSAVEIK